MIVVKITGGLGNQMFQYAYARALKQKGYEVKIDISAITNNSLHGGYQLDKYNINIKKSSIEENNFFNRHDIVSRVLKKLYLRKDKSTKEKNFFFSNNLLNLDDDTYVYGYFQSERYFMGIRKEIRKDFTITGDLSDYTRLVEKWIQDEDSTVSLHVRRGDYISNKRATAVHGICSMSYYQNAIKMLNSKFHKNKYFIFSDDIQWCKENLKINNAIYVDNKGKSVPPHEDLYLMSLCSHNIIANSTFSWWGGWLNPNPEKTVVAPIRWFANEQLNSDAYDLVPSKWIRM